MTQPNPDPTPAEIAHRCARIQAGWTPAERMRRLRVDLRPMFRGVDGEFVEISSDVYGEHHSGQAPGY